MLSRLLWALAAAGGVWWATTHLGTTGRLAVADPVRYVPLTGGELFEKLTPDQCLPHVDEIVTHPNWSIGVAVGWHGCMGYDDHGTYEIHSDGKVDYHWLQMTRTLELSAGELALVRQLGRFDCTGPRPGQAMSIGLGPPSPDNGRLVRSTSPLGELLLGVLDDAVARYVRGRIWELQDAKLSLRVGKMRVTLDHQVVRVYRHGRRIRKETLDDAAYVDLLDTILLRVLPEIDHPEARGRLVVDGVTYPVSVPYRSYDGFAALWQYIPYR